MRNFLTAPFGFTIGDFEITLNLFNLIFQFILPVLGMVLAYGLIMLAVRKILSLIKNKDMVKTRVEKWVRIVLKFFLFLGILGALGFALGISAYRYINSFLHFLNKPFFDTGDTSISVVTIILVIPIFYMASWSGRLVQSVLEKNIFPDLTTLDESRKISMGNVARFTTLTMVLLFMLSIIGIDMTALGVVFGALGIGVGFGLQDMVANFFAGIMILFMRQIKINDRILVNEVEGNVSDIKLMSTTVTTLKNEYIIIPNSQIINQIMHNYSYHNRQVVVVNSVGVHYQTDLEKALAVMKGIGEDNHWYVKGSEVKSFIRSFDDSGITLELWVTVDDVAHRAPAFAWTNLELWKRFKSEGIEMPYPQMDVHIKKTSHPSQSKEDI
jgi:potassium-dependent mechanosensitive channel